MYQLITKENKKYWLTQSEAEGIRNTLARGANFITITRYDKTISASDVKEVGIPDFALPILLAGRKIVFKENVPTVIYPGYYLEYDGFKWQRYEGELNVVYSQTFEEFIGDSIKKLN